MYAQPGEWSNVTPRPPEGRSIGSILGAMPEIAALRTRKVAAPRNLALRRNSA